jgi:hypothetical protein
MQSRLEPADVSVDSIDLVLQIRYRFDEIRETLGTDDPYMRFRCLIC